MQLTRQDIGILLGLERGARLCRRLLLTIGTQRQRGKQRGPRRRGPRRRRRSRACCVPAAARISRCRRSRAPPSALAHAAGTAIWLVKLPLAVRALDALLYGRRPPSFRGLRHSQTPPTPGSAGALPRRRSLASLPGEGPGLSSVLFLARGSRTYPINPSGVLVPRLLLHQTFVHPPTPKVRLRVPGVAIWGEDCSGGADV